MGQGEAVLSAVLAWEHQFGRAVDAVGRLRRRLPDPADYDRIMLDRLARSLDSLDAMFEPCAADLVREGFEVDEALKIVDRHAAELHRRMGGRP